MKKIFIKFLFILFIPLLLTGCLDNSEKRNLNKKEKEAISYLEKKYGERFEVDKSAYITENESDYSFKKVNTNDLYVKFKNGIEVLYLSESNMFYDNYQSTIVNTALINEYWVPFLTSVTSYYIEGDGNITATFNYNEYLGGNFFHEYYDYNIENFLQKENLKLDLGYYDKDNIFKLVKYNKNIYIISSENSWKEKMDIVDNMFKDKITSDINFYFLTSNLYNWHMEDPTLTDRNIITGLDGFFAIYDTSDNKTYTQDYIEVIDGIYFTSNEKDFKLEEGDVKFTKVSSSELNQFIDVNIYNFNVTGSVYRIEFSNRLLALEDNLIKVNMKLDKNTSDKLYNNKVLITKNSLNIYNFSINVRQQSYYWFGNLETKS